MRGRSTRHWRGDRAANPSAGKGTSVLAVASASCECTRARRRGRVVTRPTQTRKHRAKANVCSNRGVLLPTLRELCVGRDGFPPSGITKRVTLHAATRAGGADLAGREALLKYILRPAVCQERILPGKDGLVRKGTGEEGCQLILNWRYHGTAKG
jgi:hypothetical protein